MIHLHPIPDSDHLCPYCDIRMQVGGWYIPGMRNLAEVACPKCDRAFYVDLPAGHGLYYPMVLERTTGTVHDKYNVRWFSSWLRDSYANRTDSCIDFNAEELRPPKRPVLLNCLDKLYGHSVLKLLNAQYYLNHCRDFDLVILVPRFLRWMVPDGAAAIWTVGLPLTRGSEWNDWLAAELHRRVSALGDCWLSVAFSHPYPADYDIERFTRVRPFPVEEWNARLEQPMVTLIWREDRVWHNEHAGEPSRAVSKWLKGKRGLAQHLLDVQEGRVVTLAQALHEAVPQIDFAVAGMGRPGGLPSSIRDLRTEEPSEDIERSWCRRYAESHVVIGVHGSNMLLPSAHAGAVIELVPRDRWSNLVQDILPTARDVREAMCRYRFLPLDSSAPTVAGVTTSILRYVPRALLNFQREWVDHKAISRDPWLIARRRRELGEGPAAL
jgi:hypothetical protein